ncbi:virulence factor family protein [Desulforhabdus amnigena]|jgi:type IV secretory pathway VirJ component|uniref:Virulence protein n=1 Tax=Desulforhabdus amnigena TaxID=40218 RepID=A0A9W6CZK6_9BACT|nr:AcvB/VirJ family lysyl-phosphatidylglycerol hydrolase [Desulforhabdus amnigena]NLJ27326.1 virulence factor family protein [Deltaproteobacteria bacterium]GLI34681.1 virulence protein [Desulforhabdus amnigena]
MKRALLGIFFVLLFLAPGKVEAQELPALVVRPFGTVRLYKAQEHPSRVVILVSGEEGWSGAETELAVRMASLDCLVMGIDATEYLRPILGEKSCTYPASDFENLSRFIQQKLVLPQYTPPILAGCSAGAALVYATLVQAPVSIFTGGISIDFCPVTPLTRGVCRGLGLGWDQQDHLLPVPELRTPWVVLSQSGVKECSSMEDAFLKQVKNVQILTPQQKEEPGTHILSTNDPLLEAITLLSGKAQKPTAPTARDTGNLKGLPLVEVPAGGSSTGSLPDLMAVFLSGDGGWAGLDREVGEAIANHGIPVVGLNSLRYFWTPRTPEETAQDIAATVRHYLKTWKKEKVILIGYSFGADVLPFVVNRLPEDLKVRIDRVALIGPSRSAQFQFHLTDWFQGASDNSFPTQPEVQRMKGQKILCLFGKEEDQSLCPDLTPSLAEQIPLPGGHHFDGNYPAIAAKILSEEGAPPADR